MLLEELFRMVSHLYHRGVAPQMELSVLLLMGAPDPQMSWISLGTR